MRTLFLTLATALAAFSAADTLINIPTGRKVPYRVVRFEVRFDTSNVRQFETSVDWGIDTSFDTHLVYEDRDGQRRVVSGNIGYNYVAPITGISPGISVGLLDVGNRSREGRRAYAAMTYRVGGADLFNPVELSFGASFGIRPIGFIGLAFPFSEEVRFLAEHDGRKVSAGLEYKPTDSLALRWLVEDSRPQLAVRWQTRL